MASLKGSGSSNYVFKETRVNLEPSWSAAVVNIRIPPANGTNSRVVAAAASSLPRRANGGGDHGATEEELNFRRRNLATASSIYHREWHDSPRSFLWRILEDGAVLSLRALDVCREEKQPDAPLVLNFHFSVPLRPACLALAHAKDHDSLWVFVLDQANWLHTLHLRPDAFRKRSTIEATMNDLCRSYLPNQINGFKHPHRLVAASPDLLVVTLHDGGIIRMDRNKGHDWNHPWRETVYSSQGWTQSLKSLIPISRSDTVRFGKVNMEMSAATSVQVTNLGLDDKQFLFTICLDHQMRIWDLNTGQILHTSDILNADRNPQEMGKWTIDPSQTNLIRIVGEDVGRRVCVTYSPVGSGEFKFWKVRLGEDGSILVEDAFPDAQLDPTVPTLSDVWTLADFVLATPLPQGNLTLWALWKNNMTYRVQRLVLDYEDITHSWQNDWDSVYIDTSVPTAQTSGPSDPTDSTERWLQLILHPGRYTKSTLETALSLFERSVGAGKEALTRHKGLAEAICSVIASTAMLDRKSSGEMDYEQFRASSEISWRRFNRLVQELEKQRGEAMSLVLDPEFQMTWVVCTDLVCALRACSPLEMLYHNPSRSALAGSEQQERTSTLLSTGLSFLDVFSDNIWQLCNAVLRSELFEDTSKTDFERIQYFFDKAGFWRGITDEDCAQVVENLGTNFSSVTNSVYDSVMKLISSDGKSPSIQNPLTEFGRKLVLKALQEMIELQWKVCFSQLILLVHMEFECEQEEDALHHTVDVGAYFRQLVNGLRRLESMRWLTKTDIFIPVSRERSSSGSTGSPSAKRGVDEVYSITCFEGFLGHLLGFDKSDASGLDTSLTHVVMDLCAADGEVEMSPTLVQCSLVKRDRADLALELAPFCDQNPFSVYVQGRVFLALKDFNSAAIHFKKAAIGMSAERAEPDRHGGGLLDDTEWALLNKGLAKYYSHIVAIYERGKAYSYVVEFARLGTQFAITKTHEAAVIRTELYSRMFNAALVMSRFDLAQTAMIKMEDEHLQQASLRKLVDRMTETYHNIELASLPFPGLVEDVDRILEEKCKATIDVVNGIPYHQILYAWRIKHQRHQAAALILYERIQKLKSAGEGDKFTGEYVLDSAVTREYLLCINALSILPKKERWILPDEFPTQSRPSTEHLDEENGVSFHGKVLQAVLQGDEAVLPLPDLSRGAGDDEPRRRLVTLEEIRREYQSELKRIRAIEENQFGFEADDMDIL